MAQQQHSNGRIEMFVDDHDPLSYASATRDRSVVSMVQQALRHKRVKLAYQAVVPAGNQGHPAFYEGLIRVLDETGRIIPAGEFIGAIETSETGRIIDSLALEIGLRTLADYPDLRLAINMSARSIGYARWNRTLKRGLSEDPTIAERLILEVTENSAMLMPDLVVGFMTDLQRKGVSFALDDFGAGYTSFRYLKDFYFDILKIDGQFVRNVARDSDNQIIVASMAGIGRQFDMVTVAENVEDRADAAWLTTLGVDCLQGYYFGAPTIRPPWLDADLDSATA